MSEKLLLPIDLPTKTRQLITNPCIRGIRRDFTQHEHWVWYNCNGLCVILLWSTMVLRKCCWLVFLPDQYVMYVGIQITMLPCLYTPIWVSSFLWALDGECLEFAVELFRQWGCLHSACSDHTRRLAAGLKLLRMRTGLFSSAIFACQLTLNPLLDSIEYIVWSSHQWCSHSRSHNDEYSTVLVIVVSDRQLRILYIWIYLFPKGQECESTRW